MIAAEKTLSSRGNAVFDTRALRRRTPASLNGTCTLHSNIRLRQVELRRCDTDRMDSSLVAWFYELMMFTSKNWILPAVGCVVGAGLCGAVYAFYTYRRKIYLLNLKSNLQVALAPKLLPLTTIEGALEWTPGSRPADSLCRAFVGFSPPPGNGRKQMMVCHDMAGGYHGDALVQGSDDWNFYQIWDWRSIDACIYFSHSMVTIPPPGWTNAAHKNGTKSLGCLVFEWDYGKDSVEELLKDEKTTNQLIDKLIELAVYFGFDGWLLNFEVELNVAKIPALQYFCENLTNRMHETIPHSMIVWYDAITIEGKLEWQDCLDEKNLSFFNITDAILVNYTWGQEKLTTDRLSSRWRNHSVFVGFDVYGRNTKEYGPFLDMKPGLGLVKDADLSACLFAPAYTYEEFPKSIWKRSDDSMWEMIIDTWGEPRKVLSFPLVTNFSKGCGRAMFIDGKQESDTPWFNMSLQSILPERNTQVVVSEKRCSRGLGNSNMEAVFSDFVAYTGGSSLRIQGDMMGNQMAWCTLFNTQIVLQSNEVKVKVTAMFNPFSRAQVVCVMVPMGNSIFPKTVETFGHAPRVIMGECQEEIEGTAPHPEAILSLVCPAARLETVSPSSVTEQQNGGGNSLWRTLEYSFQKVKGYTMLQVGMICFVDSRIQMPQRFEATLGELQVVPGDAKLPMGAADVALAKQDPTRSSGELSIITLEDGSKHMNVHLTWRTDPNDVEISRYDIYCSIEFGPKWIGVAHALEYWVAGLEIPADIKEIEFFVQPVSIYGDRQPLKEAANLKVGIASEGITAAVVRTKNALV
ncbi:hypothetical protein BSKO_13271 [Bryopsis sp. KO-2023]|nr:hypothetical protein BSKO_13271 [Bryopsis sp. KO-2023]